VGVGVGVGNPFEPQLPILVTWVYIPMFLDVTPPSVVVTLFPVETVPSHAQILINGVEFVKILVCCFWLQSVYVNSILSVIFGFLATLKYVHSHVNVISKLPLFVPSFTVSHNAQNSLVSPALILILTCLPSHPVYV